VDPLVGSVSPFAQAVPPDRVIAFTANEADTDECIGDEGG
jgi:hypothetical protein